MEITVIHGQRHHGSTYHITAQLRDALAGGNGVVHEFYLPTDGPSFCVGCSRCILQDEALCPQRESVATVEAAILRSQVILIDSPTYCLEMTGQLKTLFDHFAYLWLLHRPRPENFHKVAAVVSTAAGGGAKGVTKSIARQLGWWGVPYVRRIHAHVYATRWEDVSQKQKEQLSHKARQTAQALRRHLGGTAPSLKTRVLFAAVRGAHRKGKWNEADRTHWERHGWLARQKPWA